MIVAVRSRGRGVSESKCLKKLIELLRKTGTGFLTTLCTLASSGAGEPAILEALFPMTKGVGVAGVNGS